LNKKIYTGQRAVKKMILRQLPVRKLKGYAGWAAGICVLLYLLVACSQVQQTSTPGSQTPGPVLQSAGLPTAWMLRSSPLPPMDTPTPAMPPLPGGNTLDPSLVQPLPGSGQPVSIEMGDGSAVQGQYYPAPSRQPSAGLLLINMQEAMPYAWAGLPQMANAGGFSVLSLELDYEADIPAARLDVQASRSLDWLAEQPEVDGERLYVAGASLGANLAVRLAASSPNLQGLVLLSPVDERYGLPLPEVQAGLPPVWMASAQEDPFFAGLQSLAPPGSARRVTHIQVSGEAHGANLLAGGSPLLEEILDWLEAHLAAGPGRSSLLGPVGASS
jgi:hypothetical protein